MAIVLDGKALASKLKEIYKEEVKTLCEQYHQSPSLAVIQVGDDPASSIYVRNKERMCKELGIDSYVYRLEKNISQRELEAVIKQLNANPQIHGILVQLPLPDTMNTQEILSKISSDKDVDGFHPISMGKLLSGQETFLSCTPAGIITLLKEYGISIAEKECVVIGRSNIVGKPVSILLLQENGTVTICHSKTKNLQDYIRKADILIVAAGKAHLIKASVAKKGSIIIDVGIHRNDNNKLTGDVDFSGDISHLYAYTPVPGGVGPMTIMMLMKNCIDAFVRSLQK